MEDLEDEIQAQASKFQRLGNGGKDSNNEKKEVVRRRNVGGGRVSSDVNNNDNNNTSNFQSNWQHHSSRIIRVSRTSGGKDRHSKVMTSKGLRDRRVRLSVTTAIQFYDLQDRLGYDQPSKAVEWLIKAATDSISELPSLNTTPETPKQLPSEQEKTPSHDHHHQQQQQLVFDEANGDDDTNNHQYHQNQISLSKSACSSNSETSKGSGLSLSRSEIRVKARERARERAAKEKENDSIIAQQQQQHHHHHHHNVNNNHNMSQTASFTELLTGAIGTTVTVPRTTTSQNRNQWSSTVTPMDYFSTTSVSALSGTENHSNHELQLQQQQQQHFPFMHENLMQPQIDHHQQNGSHHHQHHHNDYNLNFTISSGLAAGGGYNRGTLQSNSPSLNLPHLQRFSTMDGSSSTTSSNNTTTNNNLPFFIGAANANANANAAPPAMENHHHHLQFSPFFDSRLQLFYGDGSSRHSDHKGKGNKNN